MRKRSHDTPQAEGTPRHPGHCASDRWIMAAIAVAALVPRILIARSLPVLIHLDSGSYFEIAQRLWRTGTFGDLSRRMPLYPLLISLLGKSSVLGLFPLIALQHVMGVAGAVLLFPLLKRILGERHCIAAAIACLFAALAIFPVVVEQSLLADSLFAFLLLCSANAVAAWLTEGKRRYAVLTGLLLALGALTKPVAGGILPLWILILFLLQGRKKAMAFARPCGLTLLLLLAPLLIRNSLQMGRLSLTESLGRNLISVSDRFVDFDHGDFLAVRTVYKQFFPGKRGPDAVIVYAAMPRLRAATGMSDVAIDRALGSIAVQAIRNHPWEFLQSRLRRLPVFWRDPNESVAQSLHEETYFPLLSFVGKQDPDLVARSLAPISLRNARFRLALWTFHALRFQFPSGWWMLLAVCGMGLTIWKGNRITASLTVSLVLYLWASTIFLQPPNARYRLLSYFFEIAFAVAAISYVCEWIAQRAANRSWLKLERRFRAPLGTAAIAVAILIVCGRVIAAGRGDAFTLADWRRTAAGDQSHSPASNSLLREVTIAGRAMPVLYWSAPGGVDASRATRVRVQVKADELYQLQEFYSCSESACAGALLHASFFDYSGAALAGNDAVVPLAHERDDSDLFWDQQSQLLRVPSNAAEIQLEVSFQDHGGGVVIPYLGMARVSPFAG